MKDVIDVAGLPTLNGSAACAGAGPAAADAPVVARLRDAGARIVGKTVTTEFAFTDPTDCRNPYAPERSPGGSSSGSGAAVGAGMVDIALGTQTAGSLCRPAAYCGAVGFKPGLGALPMQGVTPLSPSFDMVGIIARSVDLARTAFQAMSADSKAVQPSALRLGTLLLDEGIAIDPERLEALSSAADALAEDGEGMPSIPAGLDIGRIVADHRTVMIAEAAERHGHLLDDATAGLLRPNFRQALVEGVRVSPGECAAALARLMDDRAAFWTRHADIDAFLTLPVPDGPPLMGGTTGFQNWLTVWTVLGGPLLCLPWGLDGTGLPRSVMLAGRPGGDAQLLGLGDALAAEAPPLPPPPVPSA